MEMDRIQINVEYKKKILGGRSLFGAIFGSRDMESQENLILF